MVIWFWEQLDRGVATIDWILKFLTVRVHILDFSSSNHKPLCLCSNDENLHFYHRKHPFRFEAMWLKNDNCDWVVPID